MDNEYKVSWIDTNPQNSSMNQEYILSKNRNKKREKKESAEEDSYNHILQGNQNKALSRYELKKLLDSVLKHLPDVCSDKLLLHPSSGFVSYINDK